MSAVLVLLVRLVSVCADVRRKRRACPRLLLRWLRSLPWWQQLGASPLGHSSTIDGEGIRLPIEGLFVARVGGGRGHSIWWRVGLRCDFIDTLMKLFSIMFSHNIYLQLIRVSLSSRYNDRFRWINQSSYEKRTLNRYLYFNWHSN